MTTTHAASATAQRTTDDGVVRTGIRDATWAEWTKFGTVRSTRLLAAVLGAAFPAFAVIVAATDSLQADDTILGASVLGGAVVAQVLAAVIGALLITAEFKTGMVRATLLATPRRLVVLAAKAVVAVGVTFVVSLASVVLAYWVGLALLDQDAYATGDPWPAVLGVALAISSIAVIGVAIGAVVRHAAGAVAAAIGVVLLPGLLAPVLGDAQRWVGGASLNGVMQKLTQSSDATHDAVGSLGAWPSLAIVAVYTTGAVLVGVGVLRHRDS